MATYNVFGFGFGIEQAAAALLSGPIGSSPDVTLVQECGSRAQLRRFATSLGARAVSTDRRFSRIRNAVLYRAPWELSGPHTVHDLPSQGPTYPRGLIVAPLRAGAQGLSAVSVRRPCGAAHERAGGRHLPVRAHLQNVRTRMAAGPEFHTSACSWGRWRSMSA